MINVVQPPQQQGGLQKLVQLGSLGVGIATQNPYLIASGLAGLQAGSQLQSLVRMNNEWQQRKNALGALDQSTQSGRIPTYMAQPYDAGVNYNMLAGLRR